MKRADVFHLPVRTRAGGGVGSMAKVNMDFVKIVQRNRAARDFVPMLHNLLCRPGAGDSNVLDVQ